MHRLLLHNEVFRMHAYCKWSQSVRGVWVMPSIICFNFWLACKWSGSWAWWSLWVLSSWTLLTTFKKVYFLLHILQKASDKQKPCVCFLKSREEICLKEWDRVADCNPCPQKQSLWTELTWTSQVPLTLLSVGGAVRIDLLWHFSCPSNHCYGF